MIYDCVIIGGGMSGLALSRELIVQGFTQDKSLLVIEARDNYDRDKIWSFWDVPDSDMKLDLDSVALSNWDSFITKFDGDHCENRSYRYYSIDSELYYRHHLDLIDADENCELVLGRRLKSIRGETDVVVELLLDDGSIIRSRQVFDSRVPDKLRAGRFDLLQHFVGWHVRFDDPLLDPSTFVLMDFDVPQVQGLNFMYVLPIDKGEAVFEATWFSPDLLELHIYEDQIRAYLERYKSGYEVVYREQGVIPMAISLKEKTSYSRWIDIGTRGGHTRPSTGYTFLTSQIFAREMAANLVKGVNEIPKMRSSWVNYLDEILIRVLHKHPKDGPEVFYKLFNRNDTGRVIRFLSGTSKLRDDLIMMVKIPKMHLFFKEAVLTLLGKFRAGVKGE